MEDALMQKEFGTEWEEWRKRVPYRLIQELSKMDLLFVVLAATRVLSKILWCHIPVNSDALYDPLLRAGFALGFQLFPRIPFSGPIKLCRSFDW